MKKYLFIFFIILSLLSNSEPLKIKLVHENRNAYPWVVPNEDCTSFSGIDIEFLKLIGEKTGTTIEFSSLPWQRALEEMKQGNIDGIFASSYKKERELYGAYPKTKDNEIDVKRILHTSGYSLYVHIDSKVNFDGKYFYNVDKKIAVQNGFSIVDDLKKFNVELYVVGSANPLSILQMTAYERVSGGALQSDRADNILENNPELMNRIKKISIDDYPFSSKPYFLMFSHQFKEKYPEITELFWKKCEELYNSKEYKKIVSDFYKNR